MLLQVQMAIVALITAFMFFRRVAEAPGGAAAQPRLC